MVKKIIPFNVAIKSTATRRSYDIPKAYTNDLNSVEFQFTITDMTAGELTTAKANVLLYMLDGSFFENNEASGVTIEGNVVTYTMKSNEGNHSGVNEAQVEIIYEGAPDKKLASQKYEFEIINGLDMEVAVEIVVKDWSALTTEARKFIDDSTVEVNALKNELQNSIETANTSLGEFDVALQNGIVAANLAEKLEDFEEINNSRLFSVEQQLEHKAEQTYVDAKIGNMGNTKTFKGACTNAELLLKTGMMVDDYWYVSDLSTNKCYNGTSWVDIGDNLNLGDNTISRTKIIANFQDAKTRTTSGVLVKTTVEEGTPLVVGFANDLSASKTVYRSGKNLLSNKGISNQYVAVNADGSITINGTPSTDQFVNASSFALPAGSYYLSAHTQALQTGVQVLAYDGTYNNQLAGATFKKAVVLATAKTINIRLILSAGVTFNNYVIYPQMEVGLSKTDFAGFSGTNVVTTGTNATLYALGGDNYIWNSASDEVAVRYNEVLSELAVKASTQTYNLVDNSLIIRGRRLNNVGTTYTDATAMHCDYLAAVAGQTVSANEPINYIAFYADKTEASYLSASSSHAFYGVPSGANYFRAGWVNNTDEFANGLMLCVGSGADKMPFISRTVDKNQLNKLYGYRQVGALELKTAYHQMIFDSIGDSITAQEYYQPFISAYFGLNAYHNHGVAGSCVSGIASDAMWQDVRVDALNASAQVITIAGGSNDGVQVKPIGSLTLINTDTANFVGAYNTLIGKIYTKYGNDIMILLITPPYCHNADVSTYADAVVAIGKLWGIPVADTYHNAQINAVTQALYLPGGIHPNEDGHKLLASVIIGKLKEVEPVVI